MGRKQAMRYISTNNLIRQAQAPWQGTLLLLLFFGLFRPLWAPVSPGWCKAHATMTVAANLSFGSFATTDIGLIDVNTAGARSASGNVVLMGGTVSAGVFNLAGCPNSVFSVVLPPNTVISSATSSMTISTFQSNPNGSGVLDAAGVGLLTLGGILNVGTAQPADVYTGTFTLELIFQ